MFPPMNLGRRSVPAMLLLAALASPWAMGVAATHGLPGHHHHDQADHAHAEAFELIVHGHHHEPGTPQHQHSLAVAKPATPTLKLSFVHDLAASVHPGAVFSSVGSRVASPHADPAHAPPPIPATSPILRI